MGRPLAFALVVVLAASWTASAQITSAEKPDPDAGELRAYRLSLAALQNVTTATLAMADAFKKHPELKQLSSSDKNDKWLSAMEADLANAAPVMEVLKANGLTAREYAKFVIVAIHAYVVVAFRQAEAQPSALKLEVAPENVQFVKTNQAAIERMNAALLELDKVAWPGSFFTHRVLPSAAGFLASDPAKIKARRRHHSSSGSAGRLVIRPVLAGQSAIGTRRHTMRQKEWLAALAVVMLATGATRSFAENKTVTGLLDGCNGMECVLTASSGEKITFTIDGKTDRPEGPGGGNLLLGQGDTLRVSIDFSTRSTGVATKIVMIKMQTYSSWGTLLTWGNTKFLVNNYDKETHEYAQDVNTSVIGEPAVGKAVVLTIRHIGAPGSSKWTALADRIQVK